jgi:beta-N-acetylhexosaminidase
MPASRDILRARPFNLSEEDVEWVQSKKAGLTGRRRLAQLINVMLLPEDERQLDILQQLQPGAITQFTLGSLEGSVAAAQKVIRHADIPPLVSGDVEGGTICLDGATPMPNQLGMAALPDEQAYRRALQVMVQEARAIGIDWTFSPVVDINADFRSTIVGTRSFGSSAEKIGRLGTAHVGVVQAAGLAATAKHWPGEGFDARDQHVLTTVNPLSVEQWQATFGKLYADLIASGVLTIMAGHIAWPAWARSRGVSGIEAYRPASISRLLNVELLRDKLGFNGLLTSDATEMGGLTSWSTRDVHLPEIIENGCDMILFSQDLEGDIRLLERALQDGRLSERRVDEALSRVLGLKAALGLHRRGGPSESVDGIRDQLRTAEHLAISQVVSSASVTLVKDAEQLLPINPLRHRRITLIQQSADPELTPFTPLTLHMAELLEAKGFVVRVYNQNDPPNESNSDLLMYVLAHESLMTSGAIHFDWRRLHGPIWHAMRRYWHELPSLLISFGHPYYLNEAPRMPCVINAYTAIQSVQEAVVRKLLGEEPFVGVSPVDAFCGHEDARY